jgi:hypothetical protein
MCLLLRCDGVVSRCACRLLGSARDFRHLRSPARLALVETICSFCRPGIVLQPDRTAAQQHALRQKYAKAIRPFCTLLQERIALDVIKTHLDALQARRHAEPEQVASPAYRAASASCVRRKRPRCTQGTAVPVDAVRLSQHSVQAAMRDSADDADAVPLSGVLEVTKQRTYYLPERLFMDALSQFSQLQHLEGSPPGGGTCGGDALRWQPADPDADRGAQERAQQDMFDTALRAFKVLAFSLAIDTFSYKYYAYDSGPPRMTVRPHSERQRGAFQA